MENAGPCEKEALALVLAFFKRRNIQIIGHKDHPHHRDIEVTLGGAERVKVQVHSKGGIAIPYRAVGGPLYSLLTTFTNAVGTSPGTAFVPPTKGREPDALAALTDRVAALETQVAALIGGSP